ncbi:Hsp20/alpha crystallin family protein [Hymenobacter edaphi]|uniref:Hsp20/alpha crystallin family protein n=1 Tax=Hymenobacter edaphi TaxID=2211146 RepID=A0A328BAJ7_9BACT|nr:Hsp20/alpha crystallin family protein [Hymenobacter edaphi]RAK62724.1 Hsp20/alpha crystallin family protein [Hymenobacter edaphi]
MAIQRYSDAFGDLMPQSFSAMMDRFFNDSMNSRGQLNAFVPHVDAYETEQSYEIEAALPGLKRDDIKVEFQHGRLSISGERRLQQERHGRRYHLLESQYGSFHRSFQLPDVASAQGIDAQFEDGVLRISVPKDQQKTLRHQIQVRGAQPAAGGPAHPAATAIAVESGPGSSQRPAAREAQPVHSNAAMASHNAAASPGVSGQPGSPGPTWTSAHAPSEHYGDGHPDDGAGSERRG